MKNIYIFTRLPNAYAPKRMLDEITSLGHQGKIIDYAQVGFKLTAEKVEAYELEEKLKAPDAVIFRAPGLDGFCTAIRDALLKWLLSHNVRVLNSSTFSKWSTLDKLTQHIVMQNSSIPFIESTVFTDPNLVSGKDRTYPIIVKSYLGSHGDGVKKISGVDDFSSLDVKDSPFLMQDFLKAGKDVRVIVLGKDVVGAMQRIAQDGAYLTNYSAGGDVELFDLNKNPEVADLAKAAAIAFECEYAGVDLMQDNEGKWRILEVNRSCQFEGFEKATGDNVAKKIIEYLTS